MARGVQILIFSLISHSIQRVNISMCLLWLGSLSNLIVIYNYVLFIPSLVQKKERRASNIREKRAALIALHSRFKTYIDTIGVEKWVIVANMTMATDHVIIKPAVWSTDLAPGLLAKNVLLLTTEKTACLSYQMMPGKVQISEQEMAKDKGVVQCVAGK
ncbi:hypothetical protein DFH06DRAFT_1122846 [Mycena polygramma]|nr:hypothetical protein DFH06DRAFT_1122846 [Mycena polygramma]